MITFYKGEANKASKMILKFVSSDKTFLARAQKETKEKVHFIIKTVITEPSLKFIFNKTTQV